MPSTNIQGFLSTRLITPQQSGTEFARTKEQQAAIMRQKQDEGASESGRVIEEPVLSRVIAADAKKKADAAGGKK